jgi:hypothetical protein
MPWPAAGRRAHHQSRQYIVPDMRSRPQSGGFGFKQCNHGNMLPARSICTAHSDQTGRGIKNGADPEGPRRWDVRTSGELAGCRREILLNLRGYPAKMQEPKGGPFVPGGEAISLDGTYAAAGRRHPRRRKRCTMR